MTTLLSKELKVKKKSFDGSKLIDVRMECDLLGRLLAVALDGDVEMEYVLSYPITPIPLCLANLDGFINKNKKNPSHLN